MMSRILFVIVAVLLILSIFANGCYTLYLATIYDIDVWADDSSTPKYFVDVVVVENPGCDSFGAYNVIRTGNTTVRLEILNKRYTNAPRAECLKYVEHTFPIGSDFVPGWNYTVEINDVTVNFVPGFTMIYRAPILHADIWDDTSLTTEYFVRVMVKESCVCDKFDSYNVTRAGNTTILVDIFNRRYCTGCPDLDPEKDDYWVTWDCVVPLGSDFVPGVSYTVEVNDVTKTFIA
jgi:hypothetical protein